MIFCPQFVVLKLPIMLSENVYFPKQQERVETNFKYSSQWNNILSTVCGMIYLVIAGGVKSFGVLYTELLEYYEAGAGNTAWISSVCLLLFMGLGKFTWRIQHIIFVWIIQLTRVSLNWFCNLRPFKETRVRIKSMERPIVYKWIRYMAWLQMRIHHLRQIGVKVNNCRSLYDFFLCILHTRKYQNTNPDSAVSFRNETDSWIRICVSVILIALVTFVIYKVIFALTKVFKWISSLKFWKIKKIF